MRHYFLRADDPAKADEVRALVRRLQRMDVEVERLAAAAARCRTTPRTTAPARSTALPKGTYWITMAQAQKHWVQAMLNEDTYTPFPYFYDVTGWSNPLLFNVAGGYSGAVLRPAAVRVPALPAAPARPTRGPRVGRVPARRRHLGDRVVRLAALAARAEVEAAVRGRDGGRPSRAGGLSDVDVLLVPNGSADVGRRGPRPGRVGGAGRPGCATGGRYVGWRGGTELAAGLGISSAAACRADLGRAGQPLPRRRRPSGPLARGVGPEAWAFYEYDRVMRSPDPAAVAVSFPPAGQRGLVVSGFERGAEAELGGTAAVLDERVGSGRSVVFSFEPNFRAFTDGTQEILRNAILGGGLGAARGTSGLGGENRS